MRIWDIPPSLLCRNHLLGEHRELHALWIVLTKEKKGYSRHPETLRWVGKLQALYSRHEDEVFEMGKRGYTHQSPLDKSLASGQERQNVMINTLSEQYELLKRKGCECESG